MGILRSDRSKSTPFRTTPDIKMKWALAVCFLIAAVRAETYEETDIAEDGEARLGYITVGSDGSTSITFNATSIQNAVILGLFVLVLGALVLPLFGVSLGSLFGDDAGTGTGYGYGAEQPVYSTGYEQPTSGYSSSFSKRSIEMLGPVMEALTKAYKKYDQ